jgi:hypothetical protein
MKGFINRYANYYKICFTLYSPFLKESDLLFSEDYYGSKKRL